MSKPEFLTLKTNQQRYTADSFGCWKCKNAKHNIKLHFIA